eukprot:6752318-Prymnesium_polylepis.1
MCERRPSPSAPSARRARARVSLGLAVGAAVLACGTSSRRPAAAASSSARRCVVVTWSVLRRPSALLLVALEADVGDAEGDSVAVLLSELRRQLILVRE